MLVQDEIPKTKKGRGFKYYFRMLFLIVVLLGGAAFRWKDYYVFVEGV